VAGERVFRGTASYYARFRPGYPAGLLERLAVRAGLDGSGRLLDLGCGTGNVAIPLAHRVEEVVAVDVEPEMLAELRHRAPSNVRTVEARAEDVDASWGAFRLVTIGAALHWFDSALVLSNLALLTPAVALLGETMQQSEAMSTLLVVAEELLGERPPMCNPTIRYYEALAASPFSELEQLSVEVERSWTPDELIGLAYSTSYGSLERIGDRRAEFERELRARLKPHYRERVTVDAVLGRLGEG
jgi:2-polyprenyl-3-methyl-5-hydroxy-6-metoxy-1,4-benzoquinol methylase